MLLFDDKASVVFVFEKVISTYGEDVLAKDYEAETLLTIMSPLNVEKFFAFILVANHNQFWDDVEVFARIVPCFNNRPANFSHLELPTVGELCWCAAVSWGYNLPILYAVPLIWALMQAEALSGCQVRNAPDASASERPFSARGIALFAGLLATFFGAYQFVYRDGWRGNMTAHLGAVFPKLTGIYSDSTTLVLYQELKMKTAQYGPVVTTLPAFPQAAFLTGTPPPLPLDWKVRRETGGFEPRLEAALRQRRPVLFIEKSHAAALQRDNPADPELLFARKCLREGRLLEETPHFWISVYED
jgi:hypothetical protein